MLAIDTLYTYMRNDMNSCIQVKYNLKKNNFFLQRESNLVFTKFNIRSKNIKAIGMEEISLLLLWRRKIYYHTLNFMCLKTRQAFDDWVCKQNMTMLILKLHILDLVKKSFLVWGRIFDFVFYYSIDYLFPNFQRL